MRILMVATSYPRDVSDWRGLFIRHLVDALARRSDIVLSVWAPPGDLPTMARSITLPQESAWLAQLMAAGGISHRMRQGGLSALLAPAKLLRLLAKAYRRHDAVDAYHVNWLQCALPLPDNGKPALVTALGNDLKLLKLPLIRPLLRRALKKRRSIICPNADWMVAPLHAAFGDVAQVRHVGFGIDPTWYEVRRTALLPANASPKRWLAVLRLTNDKLGTLFEWSEALFGNGVRELHLFGPKQEDVAVPDWVHYHGPATPKQLVRDWFPTAQGLITLSRHAEGRPQVMLEAMAAGLPIIASNMPAHASLVQDGITGRLCDDAAGYGDALDQLEQPSINHAAGEAARQWARQEIGTWDDCASRYAGLYRQLLEAPPP